MGITWECDWYVIGHISIMSIVSANNRRFGCVVISFVLL